MTDPSRADATNKNVDLIYGLLGDEKYGKLLEMDPPFNMFEALEVGLLENSSSRILAYLLTSDRPHGLGTSFLDAWLNEIFLERAGSPSRTQEAGLDDRLVQLLRSGAARSQAQVEWSPSANLRRVDILIRLFDASRVPTGVIGVENKHWAGEQDKQVGDYQKALESDFGEVGTKYVLFLSPSGAIAKTGTRDNKKCPYLRCSYTTVLKAMRRVESHASPQVAMFLSSTREYLADKLEIPNVTDEDSRARELVRELYQNDEHREAIGLILKYAPTGRGFYNRFLKKWAEQEKIWRDLGEVREAVYPTRNTSLKAISWIPKEWKEVTQKGDEPFVLRYRMEEDSEKDWEVGDEIHVSLTARWDKPRELTPEKMDEFLRQFRQGEKPLLGTPKAESWFWGTPNAQFGAVWVIPTPYKLVDLGEQDEAALKNCLKEAIDQTKAFIDAALGLNGA